MTDLDWVASTIDRSNDGTYCLSVRLDEMYSLVRIDGTWSLKKGAKKIMDLGTYLRKTVRCGHPVLVFSEGTILDFDTGTYVRLPAKGEEQ